MTRLSDITSMHWQPSLSGDGVVEGVQDVSQSIGVILRTPRGSNPHRPTFGSNLYLYMDYPVHQVIPHLVREAADAIKEWELRAELVKVTPTTEGSQIILRVQWKLADGVLRETEVSL